MYIISFSAFAVKPKISYPCLLRCIRCASTGSLRCTKNCHGRYHFRQWDIARMSSNGGCRSSLSPGSAVHLKWKEYNLEFINVFNGKRTFVWSEGSIILKGGSSNSCVHTSGVDFLDADRVPAAVVCPGQVEIFEGEGEVVADRAHDAVLAVEVGGVGRGIARGHYLRDGFAAHEDGAAACR